MAVSNWFDQNLARAYPLVRGTVNAPESGPLTLLNLDNSIIVDAGFVVGPKSGFDASVDTIYLNSIRRQGNFFYFEFRCTALPMFGAPLMFVRRFDDQDFTLEYVDSGGLGLSATSLSLSESVVREMCDDPMWSGFMVSGKMSDLVLLLPVDGTVSRTGTACTLEPALIQNLARSYVTQLALANDDRIRVSASAGCPDVVFPYPTNVVHVNDRCLIGELVFSPGYNAVMRQGPDSITLGAGVGLGAGEPCGDVKLFATETPPAGSHLLEGGSRCSEALRSFNGVGGRLFNVMAGLGVTVTSVPELNLLIIDVNLGGLAIKYHVSAVSESC